MEDAYHDSITEYQKAEALECAISILERWRDLDELAEPLRTEHRRLIRKAGRSEWLASASRQ